MTENSRRDVQLHELVIFYVIEGNLSIRSTHVSRVNRNRESFVSGTLCCINKFVTTVERLRKSPIDKNDRRRERNFQESVLFRVGNSYLNLKPFSVFNRPRYRLLISPTSLEQCSEIHFLLRTDILLH